ncbi:hypothetical protein ACWD6R_39230, partial [Streptomyces sp. NPDC005151]
MRASSGGSIGPIAVAGKGPFSVGSVPCSGAGAGTSTGNASQAAAAVAAGTNAARAVLSSGGSAQQANSAATAAARAKAISLGLPPTAMTQVMNQTMTTVINITNSNVG